MIQVPADRKRNKITRRLQNRNIKYDITTGKQEVPMQHANKVNFYTIILPL